MECSSRNPTTYWRLVFILGTAATVSCASLQRVSPSPTVISNYKIGEPQTAAIGDPIIDVQSALKIPEFVALRSHEPGRSGLFGSFPRIAEGARFRAYGRLKSGDYVIRNRADTLARTLVIDSEGRALGYYDGRSGYAGGSWPAEPLFRPTESLEGQPDAFRAQMIYSGLDGNTVRAVYREFSGDFIRPAFTQELQYNLSQDSVIAYKSVKIQVLEASNSQLRYRVREDGGLTWLPNGGRR